MDVDVCGSAATREASLVKLSRFCIQGFNLLNRTLRSKKSNCFNIRVFRHAQKELRTIPEYVELTEGKSTPSDCQEAAAACSLSPGPSSRSVVSSSRQPTGNLVTARSMVIMELPVRLNTIRHHNHHVTPKPDMRSSRKGVSISGRIY